MTIQWTLVATFLYLELGFILLLLLPFISPKVWQYTFYSRVCRIIAERANVYFTVFIIVLLFFFFDSIREMLIYSSKTSVDLGQDLQIHLKLFRSQRNYYISGFTVFLWLVIRRLVILVLSEAELLSETESAMQRAQNATETVEKIQKKKEETEIQVLLIAKSKCDEVNKLRKAVEEAKNELYNMNKAVEDMKEKSLALTKEYDELHERNKTLLNKLESEKNKKASSDVDSEEEEEEEVESKDKAESRNEDEEAESEEEEEEDESNSSQSK